MADGLNRLSQIVQQAQGSGAGYNTVAAKRVDLTYNGLNQFDTITRYKNAGGGSSNLIATSTYGYDHANRLTSLDQDNGYTSTVFAGYEWDWDKLNPDHRLPEYRAFRGGRRRRRLHV